jgi:NAD(P)-dependent dehydrogenase (short-subunit alcohol dehydrogenase family)
MPPTPTPTVTPTSLLLITGGGRGIGAATARLAAREGWQVVLGYASDAAAAEAVATELRALGAQAWTLQVDVADEASVERLFSQVDTLCARHALVLRGLANNAGVVDRAQRVDEMSGERLRRMVAVNLLGSLYCAREAVRRMSTRHGGSGGAIVNLSSVAARLGAAGQYVDYAATKAAIDAFTLGLAREVATEGVRVNAVRPGVIDTEIHASGGQPERAWQLAPQIPMQRPGSADEVAQAVVWLLSPASSYTTGAVLDVSGGR